MLQEEHDDSWSAIYVRASPDHPRGGIVMKMEHGYAIVSIFLLFCRQLMFSIV